MALTPSWPGVNGLATTTDGRKAIAGLIVKDAAGVARSGVFPAHDGAIVSARGDLNVDVGAFQGAAVQFGGPILLTNDGTAQLPSNLTSPVSGTNWYVVYAKQNESTSPGTDGDDTVEFGAVVSTSSFANARTSGTRLDGGSVGLPEGALELATVQLPTGKSSTDTSGVTITQTFQYTAAAGGTLLLRNQAEEDAWSPVDGSAAYRLDTGVVVHRVAGGWVPVVGQWQSYTPTLTNLNVGSGGLAANDCEWRYEGDLVRVRFRFTLGTGASVSGIPAFTLPVNAAALQHAAVQYAGAASLYDFTATVGYSAIVGAVPGSVTKARIILAGGVNGVYAPIGAGTPFSWAGDGDTMAGEFTYKPA